eukprot:SAG22_NODE_5188_length_1067_cov_1.628099_3_plen_30_part_01
MHGIVCKQKAFETDLRTCSSASTSFSGAYR